MTVLSRAVFIKIGRIEYHIVVMPLLPALSAEPEMFSWNLFKVLPVRGMRLLDHGECSSEKEAFSTAGGAMLRIHIERHPTLTHEFDFSSIPVVPEGDVGAGGRNELHQ